MNKTLILSNFFSLNVKAKCSVLEGQVLKHVLSTRARYRAPNARALIIIAYIG
jgi:hypothetical protein